MKKIYKNLFVILFCVSFVAAIPFVVKSIIGKSAVYTEPEDGSSQITEFVSSEEDTETSKDASSKEQLTQPQDTLPKDEESNFTEVTADYFNNALFIGDSRTVGLYEYGTLKNATYFANTGMSVYNVFSTVASVPSVGKVKLNDLLSQKNYDKIYVMLGINELGYNFDATVKKYNELIEALKKLEPNAIIYIEANLHVTKERSDSDKIFNNSNIDRFNNAIKAFADKKTVFYVDVNSIFDDNNGSLDQKYTNDNAHVLGRYYADWSNWLCSKGIVK